jgi:hypothetical protein
VDGVKADKGEEQVRLDPIGPRAVGRISAWLVPPMIRWFTV